ncbi:MAG: beta strand repeat-containing protein, partial [Bacteroidota bacterium]
GDGTTPFSGTSWNILTHTYSVGSYNLIYTVTGPNGCTTTSTQTVFYGNNPAGTCGLVNNNFNVCQGDSLAFGWSGNWLSNPIGTTYIVQFTDGSSPIIFNHPPPAVFYHVFDSVSCGSTWSNGSQIRNNAYGLSYTIVNPCDSIIGSAGPCYVSAKPTVDFTVASDIICVTNSDCFTNTSYGGANISGGVCTILPNVWKISPSTGWTLPVGSLGNTQGIYDPNQLSLWLDGSDTICPIFNTPGQYTITLITGSRCGIDSISKTICVVGPPTPGFTSLPSLICAPDTLFLNNTTVLNPSCDSPTYNWAINKVSFTCPADSTKDTTFVNNTSLSSFSPNVIINNQGIYNINLSVTNVCGTYTAPQQSITVKRKPIASISLPPTLCVGQSITPTSTYQACGDTVSFLWSFPGGTPSSSTLQNPGAIVYNTPDTFLVTLTVTNSCGSITKDSTLIVYPLPNPVAVANPYTICAGQSTQLSVQNPSNFNSISWSPATGLSSITGSPITATPATTTTYTATVVNATGCSATDTVKVAVNPLPPVTITPNLSTICAGSSAILTAAGANTYVWSPGGSTVNPLTVTLNTTTSYTVTGTNTITGCTNTATTTINVNPLPTITNTSSSQTICSGASTSAVTWTSSIATSTYSWSVVNPPAGLTGFVNSGIGNLPIMSITNPGNTQGTVVYSVIPNANNCPGPAFQYTIYVNPLPNINLPATQTVCSNTPSTAFNLTSNLSGTTFTWTTITNGVTGVTSLTSGNSIPVQTLINPTNNPLTVIYNVTPTSSAGCVGTTQPYSIVVNPSPTVTLPAPQTICSGGSTSLVNLTSSSTGASITWTCAPVPGITGITASGTNTIPSQTLTNTTNTPITVNYIVTATTSGSTNCPGQPVTYSITVNPTPALTVTPAASSICSGANTSLTMSSNVSGSTYTWTIVSNGVSGASANGTATSNTTISQALSNATNTQGTVTYTVSVSANNCPGNTATSIVTVQPVATTQFSPFPQTICSGTSSSAITLSSNVTGVSYAWTVVADSVGGVTAPLTGTNSTIQSWPSLTNSTASPQTVNITATSTINGCPGPQANYTITVNPLPAITNSLSQTICSGASSSPVTWTANVSSAATYSWSIVNPPSGLTGFTNSGIGNLPAMTITNSGSTALSLVYAVIATSNNCSGQATNYTIVVNPKPTVNAITGQAICSNSSTVAVTPTGAVTNTVFNWTVTPPLGITPSAVLNGTGVISSQQWINTTNGPITLDYIITPIANGCIGDTIHFNVIVYPSPTVTLPAPQTICSGGSTSLVNLTSSSTGASITWTCAPVPGITGITASGTNTIPSQTL